MGMRLYCEACDSRFCEHLERAIRSYEAEREKYLAENAELRKDRERLDWLSNGDMSSRIVLCSLEGMAPDAVPVDPDHVREAIDAAMAEDDQ